MFALVKPLVRDREEAALLAAVSADRPNDGPRLAYADWLDGPGGDPLRAEFIRLQCAGRDFRRQNELYSANVERWLGGVSKALSMRSVSYAKFERGFCVGVVADSVETLIGQMPSYLDRVPLLAWVGVMTGPAGPYTHEGESVWIFNVREAHPAPRDSDCIPRILAVRTIGLTANGGRPYGEQVTTGLPSEIMFPSAPAAQEAVNAAAFVEIQARAEIIHHYEVAESTREHRDDYLVWATKNIEAWRTYPIRACRRCRFVTANAGLDVCPTIGERCNEWLLPAPIVCERCGHPLVVGSHPVCRPCSEAALLQSRR